MYALCVCFAVNFNRLWTASSARGFNSNFKSMAKTNNPIQNRTITYSYATLSLDLFSLLLLELSLFIFKKKKTLLCACNECFSAWSSFLFVGLEYVCILRIFHHRHWFALWRRSTKARWTKYCMNEKKKDANERAH